MRAVTYWITVSIGSFLLGWGMSSSFDAPSDEASSSLSSQTNHTRPPRNRAPSRAGSDLPDIDACRALLASSKVSDSRHPLLRKLDRERALRRWIVLDPDSAMKEAEANPSSAFSKDLFLSWVSLNPSNALQKLNQGSALLKRAISTDVFVALFQKDARLAVEELQSPRWQNKGTSILGWRFHQEVYRQWALSDRTTAIASLPQNNSDGKQYSGGAEQLTYAW